MAEASNKTFSGQERRMFTPFRNHLEQGPGNRLFRKGTTSPQVRQASEPEWALELKQRLDTSEVISIQMIFMILYNI